MTVEATITPDVYQHSAETQLFMQEHKDFVPTKYNPRVHGQAIEQFLDPSAVSDESTLIDANVAPGERASYNGHFSPFERAVAEMIMNTGVYNANMHPSGYEYNVPIQYPDAEAMHKRSLEALKALPISVVAPFAVEPETIQGVLRYSASRVGRENTFGLDAGIDPNSGKLARETGLNIFDQRMILSHVDIQELVNQGILPDIEELKGSKGLTMFAALIMLYALGRLDGQYVAFHDTDIVNCGPSDGSRGSIEDYAALDYLGLPFAFPVGEINAVHIGRTGPGRNNESWHGENQHYLSKDMPHDVRRLAHNIAPLMWPLTGERLIKGDVLKRMPWAVDMNIETLLDFTLAGLNVESGEQRVMQVANPAQKIENRESTDPREWGMIYGCEKTLRTYYDMYRGTGRLAHQWDIGDIQYYNHIYGNRSDVTATKAAAQHMPNTLQKVVRGVLMPSIEQMLELGVIDIEGLQKALGQ